MGGDFRTIYMDSECFGYLLSLFFDKFQGSLQPDYCNTYGMEGEVLARTGDTTKRQGARAVRIEYFL